MSTVGHGRLDQDDLAPLLLGAGVELLVDVRRFPGSRSNSSVSRDALSRGLPQVGVGYRWEERLGGRRRLPKGGDDDRWWQVDAFHGMEVRHLMHDGRLTPHRPSEGARRRPDGLLVWDRA